MGGHESESIPETLVSEGEAFDGPGGDDRELSRGAAVGRYVVLGRLGAGGMGVVYEAYDPELDRRVAIKLLRQRGQPSLRARQRLLREAQALARVSHPNVVAVHDVGTFDDQVFLAMEFIAGETLGTWLQGRPQLDEVLDVFVRAGRGLAAAHAGGLVHRDFKPDNVMIANDGRVRVMDFGLARLHGVSETSEVDAVDPTPTPEVASVLASPLTVTGAMMGTPAYMSPEQHAGLPTDARTDQFSYCVALYEGLYGERPFAGATLARLGLAVAEGRIEAPPRDAAVPAWIRRVVVRGLAAEPARRWPDMQALTDALVDDPTVRRRRRVATAVGAVALAGVVAAGWAQVSADANDVDPAARCEGAREHLGDAWDEARQDAVARALEGADLPFARDTATKVVARLDAYAVAWAEARRDACEATWIRGEQSEALLDARMACLQQRRASLAYLTELLAGADTTVAASSVRAVAELPAIAPCGDLETLRGRVAPPTDPRQAQAVAELRETLALAHAQGSAGRIEAAVQTANGALERARQLDYGPAVVERLARLGSLEIEAGRFDDATRHLEQAYFEGLRIGHDRIAASAAAQLVYVVGYKKAQHERGEDWMQHAIAVARRSGDDTVEEAAAAHYSGVLHDATGRHDQGLRDYQRAYDLRCRHLGARHPETARTLNNIGNIHLSTGDYEEAADHYRRALALREEIFGDAHPELTGSLNNLALVMRRRGQTPEAGELLGRAIDIVERTYGPDHASLAQYLANLAAVERDAGRYARALELDERALQLRIDHWGPEHPDVGDPLAGLAATYEARGELDVALDHYRRALALYEASFDGHHPIVVSTRVATARVLLALGARGEAQARLEQALADARAGGAEPVDVAEGQFMLARLLGERASSSGDAHELARAARDAYADAGPGYEAKRDAVQSWLDEAQASGSTVAKAQAVSSPSR